MIIISCWLVIVVTVRQLPFGLISHSLLLESKSTNKDAQDSNSGIHTNHTKESPWYFLASKNRSIVYVHVGKTGGTTLDGVFRSNCEWYRDGKQGKKCFQSLKKGNHGSLLSQLTKRTIHTAQRNDDWKWIRDNSTTFLFTVRNPIARAVSAFNFDHPTNVPTGNDYWDHLKDIFYGKCFPTVEDLSIILTNKNDTKKVTVQDFVKKGINSTIDCFEVGTKVLEGNGHVLMNGHLSKNYESYTTWTTTRYPDKEVFVIRTEELWNDVEALNHALVVAEENQTDHKNETPSLSFAYTSRTNISHGSETFSVSSGLSKEGRAILCCYLSNENKLFEELVRRAVNLAKLEKEKYLDQLYSDCGIPIEESQQHGGSNTFAWNQWRKTNCPFSY